MVVWYVAEQSDVESEQSSPFRRWTTGSGAGSSYRHHDHRNMYSKAYLCMGSFWWSCEQYRVSGAGARERLAAEIWSRHLADGAPEPVNVDAAARRAAAARTHLQPPPDDLFLQAQKQIFNVMKFDSYPRFLRSGVHAECARADLRGLPPPYAPAHNAPATEDATPTKVVKCGTQGASSLCRVVLPDGATSVVGVAEGVPVRHVIDRLLQRRNLHVPTYDVQLRDEQGVWRTIEGGAECSALAGREVVVVRRVVLRLVVGPRLLAVRCRPARPLRHVLRHVLRRHALTHQHVLRNSRPVDLDTPVQELEGAVLEIGEPCEEVVGGGEREEDADSLSDLAVRLQEDTDHMSVSSRNRESGGAGAVVPAANIPIGSNGNSNGNGSSGNVSTAGSNGSTGVAGGAGGEVGRVRAALRPGPPLHHHPPEFLENLREKQRQRQNPRTPPPLPPKPAQRTAPTVV
ncbi:Regulator of G-protein signaling loco [Papilio xuthus]|uniref:Regulator of G-protein signaling loco n=1 Tax=Papilio xuthus TaxID=66420 RepID=A0A0N0P9J8_PAPXU|nr:Regulator of G-protein signaling loco [Papilio xuthus]